MVRSGPTRIERSLSTLAILPSSCPSSLYSGLISSSVKLGWTPCSNREWRIISWTLVLSLKPLWPLSCPTPLAWTSYWDCTLLSWTGGSRLFPSPSWSSFTMNAESSFWDVTPEDGSSKKLIIKDNWLSGGSNLWPCISTELLHSVVYCSRHKYKVCAVSLILFKIK